ncbi:rhomboid family intramembrane serine protease [Myxococcota bacterium]|nr:rhomboid family intramembrane serine protease [Myxococcota bacterium]
MAGKRPRAVLCSSCRQLISDQEKRCPYCGAVAPGLFGLSPGLQKLFRDHLEPTTVLVGTCVLMYGLSLVVDPSCVDLGIHLDFGSPSGQALSMLGMTSGAALARGHVWTLLTASFLHGSLLHIAFNMSWLRSLAPTAIAEFGPGRAVLIALLSGVGCFLLSDLWTDAPTVGASGAVFGLMGALLAFGKRRGGTFGAAIRGEMLYWAGLMFFMGMAMSGVNNVGHLGGFLTGLALGFVLPYKDRQRETRLAQLGALALLLLVVAGFAASVLVGLPHFSPGRC